MCKKTTRPLVAILFAASLFIPANSPPAALTGQAVREVSVIILVDQDFQENATAVEVETDIKKIVAAASKVYEKEFGIAFTIKEIRDWNLPAGKEEVNADNAIFDAASVANGETADIAIGMVRKPLFKCRLTQKRETQEASGCGRGEEKNFVAGYAYVLGNAAVISLKENGDVFIHEIGHIFGAGHTEKDSIMNDREIGKEFDVESHAIILKNRNHVFEKLPLP